MAGGPNSPATLTWPLSRRWRVASAAPAASSTITLALTRLTRRLTRTTGPS